MKALVVLLSAGTFVWLASCGSDAVTIPTASPDASPADAADASATPDAAVVDGPGAVGETCSFNKDCMAALRCECSEANGCACQTGVRGTGRNGVDPCPGDDGSNLCASALCVEGPDGTGNWCSDECTTDADCTGMLPKCTDIDFVGRVCVRSQ